MFESHQYLLKQANVLNQFSPIYQYSEDNYHPGDFPFCFAEVWIGIIFETDTPNHNRIVKPIKPIKAVPNPIKNHTYDPDHFSNPQYNN